VGTPHVAARLANPDRFDFQWRCRTVDVLSTAVGTYTLDDVARITGVSRARLKYWERTALLESTAVRNAGDSHREGSEFEFGDLVTVRSVLSLLDRGVSLRRIRRSVDSLKKRLPEVDRPLGSLRPWLEGSPRVVIRHDGVLVEPDGQLVLEFGPAPMNSPVTLCVPASSVARRESAADWFEQGCKLDSNRNTYAEAIKAYERAIECDPDCADAHCNLGSVFFNQDRLASSRSCFERSLAIDPHHIEANLNLATLLEEEGRYQMALRHYKRALVADPMYADAHVSLALAYEKIGLRRKARGHWRRYLQLEPSGTWVEIARQRLQE
jgi:DNA-binding transcriptional MerR regulator